MPLEKIQDQRDDETDQKTRRQRKIKREIVFSPDNIARKPSEPRKKLKRQAENQQQAAGKNQHFAQFVKHISKFLKILKFWERIT